MKVLKFSNPWILANVRLLYSTSTQPVFYFAGLACTFAASYLEILFALTLGEVVNSAISAHADMAIRYSIACVLAAAGSQWAASGGSVLVNNAVTRGTVTLDTTLIRKTLNAPYGALLSQYSSMDIRSIATQDVDAMAGMWTGRLLNVMQALITAVWASVVVWQVDPALVLIPYAAAGCSLLVRRRLLRKMAKLSYEQSKAGASFRGDVAAYLSSQEFVRAYGLTDHILDRLAQKEVFLQRLVLSGIGAQGLSSYLSGVCHTAGIGAVLALGFLRVAQGTVTAGTVLSTMMLVNRIAWPVAGLSSFVSDIARVYGNSVRVGEVLQMPSEGRSLEGEMSSVADVGTTPLVRFANVRFSYPNGKKVLDGVSFDVWRSDCVALVGPNGSGKSTLVKLLLRLYEPDDGIISYAGRNIATLEPSVLRSAFAYVPQTPVLFDGTVRENIRYGNLSATEDEICNVARICGLDRCGLQNGLETMVGERGQNISGGQQQRIQLARALLRPAEILLLDEPTTFLDKETEEELYEILTDIIGSGRTVIMVTHNQRLIRHATRVLALVDGKIREVEAWGTEDTLPSAGSNGDYGA